MILYAFSESLKKTFSSYWFVVVLSFLVSEAGNAQKIKPEKEIQIAFLSDIHLQDLYGSFLDTDYKGVLNPKNNTYTIMRTMASQLHSTRLFNENYFAFLAALDDIANRKIKYVALPGDYTDDGQPIHVRGLAKILGEYQDKYGIQFFITTGNHDPVGPFEQASGKKDFLGQDGKNQPIFSTDNLYQPNLETDQKCVVTKDISNYGYVGILENLKQFGFFPSIKNKFWATPFSNYTTKSYSYDKAVEASKISNRMYPVSPGFEVPDASYVVEPVDGIWLLAIDGNVYIPKDSLSNPKDSDSYSEASSGYNNVFPYKQHLIQWVKKINDQAQLQGKTVVAFSHFPMVDYDDGASPEIKELLGAKKWQLNRLPDESIAEAFANAGVKIHFGGHMHINDTGSFTSSKGNTLVNIQTPSLAAYIPAYKLLTIKPNAIMDVQTITINNVPRFDELFDLYKQEYAFLKSINKDAIWNKKILESKDYHDLTDFHLKELVRLRFLSNDWPSGFVNFMQKTSGEDFLILSQIETDQDLEKVSNDKEKFSKEWDIASAKIKILLEKNNLNTTNFKNWNGFDLLVDLYRLRSADELAWQDIGQERAQQYRLISGLFLAKNNEDKKTQQQLRLFFTILNKFGRGEPANHFNVNLKSGKIIRKP